jgi:AcrR family transcriptional regulator
MVISSDAIVEAFLEVLVETQNASGVNFREIARRLHCNHTNLYNYFESFDDIRASAVCRLSEKLKASFVLKAEFENPVEELSRVVQTLVRFAKSNPGLYRFLWVDSLGAAIQSPDLANLRPPEMIIVPVLSKLGGTKTSAEDVESVASIVHSFVHGEILKIICGRDQFLRGRSPEKRIASDAVRIAQALLCRA